MRTEVPQHSYRLLLTGGLLSTEQSLLPLQKPPQFVHENANRLFLSCSINQKVVYTHVNYEYMEHPNLNTSMIDEGIEQRR